MRKRYFFIGIGGVSMSGLAKWLKSRGQIVSGSDLLKSQETEELEKLGITVHLGHDENYLDAKTDYVVYSGAIDEKNPELKKARELGIKTLSRGEMLEVVAKRFKKVIAVAGAHGKTTTTEMIAEIFFNAGLEPTLHIGGISNFFNSNFYIGKNKYFITEACEYKNSFLNLKPTTAVITNIEAEHLDFFKNFENVKNSFDKFCKNSKNVIKIYKNIAFNKKFRVEAKNIKKYKTAFFEYDCYINDIFKGKIKLGVAGKHNVKNSLLAIATAISYKIDFKAISRTLSNFKGVKRRFEVIADKDITIVHDYAHHPTEIKKVLATAKLYEPRRLLVAFQPHTYSRTLSLFEDFLKCFEGADEVFIFKTYSAREKELIGGRAIDLYKKLNIKKHYFTSFESGAEKIKKRLKKGDLLLLLGAGDIENLAENFREA